MLFADAVMAMLGDPALRSRCGIEGRTRAVTVFEMSRVAARLVELYAEVAAFSAPDRAIYTK